jgi:hypothetical protein
MDRKLAKNRRPLLIKLGLVAVFGSSLAFAGYRMLQDSAVATFRARQRYAAQVRFPRRH